MKNKKLFLPAVILVVAILAIAIYSVVSSIALKPTVTEAEFPFKITYELDGERVTVEDVYKVNYVPNDADDNHKGRIYVGERLHSDDDINFIIKKGENTRIELWSNFYADHLMGDPEYSYFDDGAFEPQIYYYDENETEYHDEETLAKQGVKLISYEYPTPIKNKLVFSHIAYFTGDMVLPTLLIALLALLVTVIFVRKEKELKYQPIDILSIVFNLVIGFTLVPFVTLLGIFIGVEGGGPELYYQVTYFISAVSVLCIAASIALRRKGYGVQSLIAVLVAPAVFILYLIVYYAGASM